MLPRQILAIAAAVVALGGAIAIANPKSPFVSSLTQAPVETPASPDRKEPMSDGWLKDLKLTPDQLQKIQAIRSRYKDSMSQQKQAMQQAQDELKDLMAGDASADQVRQKYSQVRTLKQQFKDARFNNLLEIREVLTLEQRKQLAEQMDRKHGGFRERMKQRRDQSI